jgi:hypothetical protein
VQWIQYTVQDVPGCCVILPKGEPNSLGHDGCRGRAGASPRDGICTLSKHFVSLFLFQGAVCDSFIYSVPTTYNGGILASIYHLQPDTDSPRTSRHPQETKTYFPRRTSTISWHSCAQVVKHTYALCISALGSPLGHNKHI